MFGLLTFVKIVTEQMFYCQEGSIIIRSTQIVVNFLEQEFALWKSFNLIPVNVLCVGLLTPLVCS